MNNTWNKQLCDDIVQSIEEYFERDALYPPFVFTDDFKESIVDDLSAMVLERFDYQGHEE